MRVVCGSIFAPIFHPQLGTILVSQAHPSRMLSSVICSDFEHSHITVGFRPSTTAYLVGVQIPLSAPKIVVLTKLNGELYAHFCWNVPTFCPHRISPNWAFVAVKRPVLLWV